MQGKKTKPKIIADVVAKKIADPSLSTRDIAEEVWVSHDTRKQLKKYIQMVRLKSTQNEILT